MRISRRAFLKVAGATLAALGTPVATSQALFGAEPSKVRIKDAVRKLCEANDADGLIRLMGDTFAVHTPDLRLVAGIVDYAIAHMKFSLSLMVQTARARRGEPGVKEMLRGLKAILMGNGWTHTPESMHLLASGSIIGCHWADADPRETFFNVYDPDDERMTFDDYAAKYPARVAECRALADAN